jgi:cell wall-associated protease
MNLNSRLLLVLLFVAGINLVYAQRHTPKNWQLLNPSTDKVYGTGAEEAYKLLSGKTPKTVVVAVIDSGVDPEHEDLKDVIWINKGEIPDNGIDDDKNGYVDDVHGWSFIGGKTEDINYEAYEVARLYRTLKIKYSTIDTLHLSASETKSFQEFKKIRSEYAAEQAKLQGRLNKLQMFSSFIGNVKKENNGQFTSSTLKKYQPKTKTEKALRKRFMMILNRGISGAELEENFKETHEMFESMSKWNTINADSMRQAIVGDNPSDKVNRFYGCNRVKGPDADHGTHVAGIIGAMRGNNLGIDGIAKNVLIMPVRAVPNGDERDKDIANAIYYAVDNGATVINMSFGKYYSPNKTMVDEAVKYALSKDVLLIHAAGNESKNADSTLSFPSREMARSFVAPNWIQVGASSYKPGKKMIAEFSNYGSKKVDLFAPGVDVYSTTPNNKYDTFSGTSMAAPAVSGVAAIIRGYFPELKATEVRDVLMKTVVDYNKSVIVPGTKKNKKKVKELCISGGFVNTKNAVEYLLKKF